MRARRRERYTLLEQPRVRPAAVLAWVVLAGIGVLAVATALGAFR